MTLSLSICTRTLSRYLYQNSLQSDIPADKMAASSCYCAPVNTHPNRNLNYRLNSLPSLRIPSVKISTLPHCSVQLSHLIASRNAFRITALTQEEIQTTEQSEPEEEETNAVQQPKDNTGQKPENEKEPSSNRTKLYVGNLPRSCDNAYLTHLFQKFGTVESVEVARSQETGVSRGFAFVTMSTVVEAKAAIEKLQGSDLGGRDMIVNFPAAVLSKGKKGEDAYVETPYQLYVGNLAWSVKEETLRDLFSENGNVLGAKVVYNRKDGVPRAFGFVSLASQSEVEAAIASLHGKEFHGRNLVVRQVRATNKVLSHVPIPKKRIL